MSDKKKLPGRIRILRDSDPQNPRTEFDNVTVMVCEHRRYKLGDKQASDEISSYAIRGWGDVEKALREKYAPIAIKPLYMYDHSGITISTTPFSCPWDSGQVGFVLVPGSQRKEQWPETLNPQPAEEVILAWAERAIDGDVKVYDQYLTGDVYGFVVDEAVEDPTRPGEQMIDENENPVFDKGDSCWGFYGDDWKTNGMADDLQTLVDAGYTVVTD
jgi:hypothetical protein